jgi:HPt (histidine-containing phosphotransfer) domain-containing protein
MTQSGPRGSSEWQLPEELRQMAEGGDSEIVLEVLSVFQTDTASRLRTLQAALAAGDMAQVRTQAHSIKGSASQVGALGLAAVCQSIEHEAAQGPTASLTALVRELETSFPEVCRAITAGQDSLK